MNTPLSRYAPSPQGDDALAAGRPLLGVPPMGPAATTLVLLTFGLY
jgi:general secretion pathway protein K